VHSASLARCVSICRSRSEKQDSIRDVIISVTSLQDVTGKFYDYRLQLGDGRYLRFLCTVPTTTCGMDGGFDTYVGFVTCRIVFWNLR